MAVFPTFADNLDVVGAAMAMAHVVISDSDDELEQVFKSGTTAVANNSSVSRPSAAKSSYTDRVTNPTELTTLAQTPSANDLNPLSQ